MIEFVRHILAQLYDVRGLIEWGGTAFVCAIVFAETGLFVGFFLPGDSLLVTAGVFAGAGHLRLAWLLPLVTICAIAGDQLGYLIGWRAGQTLYSARIRDSSSEGISNRPTNSMSATAEKQLSSRGSCRLSGPFVRLWQGQRK